MYCVSMHRTELLLEDWQYEALRGRAEREGRSLSALVRGQALIPMERLFVDTSAWFAFANR